MSGAHTHRSRLACASCTRRKVKCSKDTPCTNCVRRGEQDSCGPPGADPYASPSPSAVRRETSSRPQSAATVLIDRSTDAELGALRRRVAELEEEQHRRNSTPPSSRFASNQLQQHPPAASPAPSSTSPANNLNPVDERHDDVTGSPSAATDRPEHNERAVMKDAASILEFLAWGRRKDPSYHTVVTPEVTTAVASGDVRDADNNEEDDLSNPFGDSTHLAVLQLLLPSPRMVWQLIEYHERCLLWYHGSYHAAAFNAQAKAFFSQHSGLIESSGVDLQWVALLFAILCASLACAPPGQVQAWNFLEAERDTLARRWYKATITCLNRAEYTANLSVFACQAIATSTISSHVLGFSNSQSIQLAAAVRIAQSLGLHRLGPDTAGSPLEKEIGRRVWCQLCSQDWFGIPFSESYLINPLYSTSEPPLNANDDLLELPEHVPTITSYCRFLRNVAAIMPRLQDGLMSCNTPFTRYEQVLAWDARLRALVTTERPKYLGHIPIESDWPSWIPWGRRALAISSSHKIIMIHRSFLSDSFTNPAFAFTRRTCLSASKTIIKEYKQVIEEDGPVLWIHQAFAVAASIILLLDILHRDPTDEDCLEHRQLVKDVLDILMLYQYSMISKRGIKLLSALLKEVDQRANVDESSRIRPHKRRRVTSDTANKFSVPNFIRSFCDGRPAESTQLTNASIRRNQRQQSTLNTHVPDAGEHMIDPQVLEASDLTHSDFNFSFPAFGLDGANGFENLLYLANYNTGAA
ncbi:hypothetical protein NLU13_6979 [Sarocladium strictum]|uniref:Zn(2)-C6 fungal-type domain-containing protein n=1 Tax=Sarocladium strictum TaxID=5046 RepID=A0AA39L6D6_SARSR|nr:hypothetical protein NLU13_6979 [Sarocladium strictum]